VQWPINSSPGTPEAQGKDPGCNGQAEVVGFRWGGGVVDQFAASPEVIDAGRVYYGPASAGVARIAVRCS
jgi:dienelactone hydrolase